MKNNSIKTMGQMSVVLLICVLLGQGIWLYHVREIKLREFRESANEVLLNTTYKYLYDEYGADFAKLYLESNENGIKLAEEIIQNENIDCDFEKKDS